jgi:hypothetical protein
MMTQQLEVSILAAPLAAIDRRVLSQAWYSALYMARSEPAVQTLPARGSGSTPPVAPAMLRTDGQPSSRWLPEANAERRSQRDPARPVTPQPAARASSGAGASLSRRIERSFSQTGAPRRRATFSLGRGYARVHVILQTNGNTATLVALCRPEMRGVVGRALLQARCALAARGITLELQLKKGQTCS